MRVLYWTGLFWPHIGGVEVLAARLLPALRDRGYELQVLTSPGELDLPEEDEWEGIPVRRVRFHEALTSGDPARVGGARSEVAALKRSFRPDLVHLNVTAASLFFELRTRACPLLVELQVAPTAEAGAGTALGSTLAEAACIAVNSEAIACDVRRLAPASADRVRVLHRGLEAPADPLPPPVEPPTIVCLGRVVRDKGFDVALAAFARVRDDFPDARLVIAGDGPERAGLIAEAERLGLGGAVELPGWVVPELVPELLARASVVAMPSRWREAFGLVALQAALAARPVVASRVGGIPEIVANGLTGLLVEPDDPEALAAALSLLLADPPRAAALGRAGRERALERFDPDAYVDAHDRLYASLAT